MSHNGRFSVYDWYQANVVPTLGDGSAFTEQIELAGAGRPGVGRLARHHGTMVVDDGTAPRVISGKDGGALRDGPAVRRHARRIEAGAAGAGRRRATGDGA